MCKAVGTPQKYKMNPFTQEAISLYQASFRALIVVAVCITSACSSNSAPFAPLHSQVPSGVTPSKAGTANLYVANAGSGVTVYAPGQTRPLRTYPTLAIALAFDESGNLYSADDQTNAVLVYAAGSTTLLRTISSKISDPVALTFDKAGNLYVANGGAFGGAGTGRTVTVYARNSTRVLRVIHTGQRPVALAFDPSGTLYVANALGNTVTVYAPGATEPSRTIGKLNLPTSLAFDSHGNLYVSNTGLHGTEGNVTVYARGSTSVLRTITRGATAPLALRIDRADALYAMNYSGAISVYAAGGSVPARTLSGFSQLESIELDRSNNLYVAQITPDKVSEYAAGGSKVLRKIAKGLSFPAAFGLGP
jgi:sugar lactone lactonase YvrE